MAVLTELPEPAAPPPAPPKRRLRIEPRYLVLAVAAVIVAYLALVPVGTMLVASLQSDFLGLGPASWTFAHYVQTFTSAGFGTLVANSFEYALATAALAVVVGFGLAWLVTRTNTPAKGFARVAAVVPLIIPGILNTVAWALLFSPQTGPLNGVLRAAHLPIFDIYSLLGMVFVQTTHMTPVAYLMGVAAFSAMDSSLEEAALSSGAGPRRVFARITLPLVRPAILSAALLMFIQTISTFEVPQLLGVPNHTFVFVSRMYEAIQSFPADYGTVAVIGVFVLFLAAVGLVASQRIVRRSPTQTVTGKGFRPRITDLGRWRWLGFAAFVLFFGVTVVLPVVMLLWSSLLPTYSPPSAAALKTVSLHNYATLFSSPALLGAVRNTAITALSAGVIVTVLTAVVAYLTTKTRIRGRGLLDGLATVPIAVPSIVLGVGVLYWYLVAPLPFHLYGTLTILVIAFVTIGLPYGMRYLAPGFAQINDELEEAATASGAGWFHAFRRIYLPLLMPSLLAAFLYTTIVAFREISAAIFLYSQNTDVMSVEIYNLWSSGDYPVVAALGILMVALLTVVVAVVRLVGGRVGLSNH
ncbi:MAG TPA: iron ABC transporter permease [Pseudonocardiaceae bacterium]|jgi:iron(III) transport system permease protein|nr:iron ABC transporter permease [Pseudonocardiaceae bacterium]